MEKEIERLINSNNAMLNINRYCRLERWTKDAAGNDVDKLAVIFSITRVNDFTKEIAARNWKDIVNEVNDLTITAFGKAAVSYINQLNSGYLPTISEIHQQTERVLP